MQEAVHARVATQVKMLADRVKQPETREGDDQAPIRAARDHWWVEWQNASGWSALDPSLPGAVPGATLCEVKATAQPRQLLDLGKDQLHRIELSIVLETWDGANVSEAAVLTGDLVPAELIGKSVVVRFLPTAWPKDPKLFRENNPVDAMKAAVLAQREWLPVLQIDGENTFTRTFNDAGELHDMTVPGLSQGVSGLGNSLGGLLQGGRDSSIRAAECPTQTCYCRVD